MKNGSLKNNESTKFTFLKYENWMSKDVANLHVYNINFACLD